MPDVVIYTRDNCSYCAKAKELLSEKAVPYKEINVGNDPGLRIEMIKKAGGRSTFPQIFFGKRHIGGCDDLVALAASSRLETLLGESNG